MEKKWYVIHTYSGYENKVKANLERLIESMNLRDKISRILIPTEDVVEFTKGGEKKIVPKKKFPGYMLVEMTMDDDAWYVVRNTQGVTSFVGIGAKPDALESKEVDQILNQMGMATAPKQKKVFEKGQSIQVDSGPFTNFSGTIEEINEERRKLKVLLSIFGRETPVELEFEQVRKL